MPTTAMATGVIIFSGHLMLVNAIPQEHIEVISSNLVQRTTSTQGRPDSILEVRGQGHCDLLSVPLRAISQERLEGITSIPLVGR